MVKIKEQDFRAEYDSLIEADDKYMKERYAMPLRERLDTPNISIQYRFRNNDLMSSNTIIFGSPGVGKTYLSQQWLTKIGGSYFKWNDIVNQQLEQGYINVKPYMVSEFIVIDDLLTKKTSEFNLEIFYDILDKRIEYGLTTFITTNYNMEQFFNILSGKFSDIYLGDRIKSRLHLFNGIEIIGKDWRQEKRKK